MHYFIKRLITTALDRNNREREMASMLLSSLYAEVRRLPVPAPAGSSRGHEKAQTGSSSSASGGAGDGSVAC